MNTVNAEGPSPKPLAVVTGASSGFGERITELLVGDGWQVYGVARDEARLSALGDRIGGDYDYLLCDIADPSQVATTQEAILSNHKTLQLLVNSAGIELRKRAIDTPHDELEDVMATNFTGTVRFTHALLPALIMAKGSDLTTITSAAAGVINPHSAVYSASKAALGAWMRSIQRDLSEYDIRTHDIRPGNADTRGHPYQSSGSLTSRLSSTDVETVARSVMAQNGQPSNEVYIPFALGFLSVLAAAIPGRTTKFVDKKRAEQGSATNPDNC